MNNKSIFLSLALIGIVVVQVSCDKIDVKLTLNDIIGSFKVDDGMTVRDLANLFLVKKGFGTNPEKLRVQDNHHKSYNLDKSLKESGIVDGTTLAVKFWSRAEDFGVKVLQTIFPKTKPNYDN